MNSNHYTATQLDTKNNDQALYAIYSDQFGDFGVQGGLRSEYTFRKISLLTQDENLQ